MKKNWSNTVLVAYSLLPKIVRDLDNTICSLVNLGFKSKHIQMGISTESLIGEIMKYTNEKQQLVELHVIVRDALRELQELDRCMLAMRINRKMTYQQIATEQNVSLRTVFRRVAAAHDKFAAKLAFRGYTESWLEKNYKENTYIAPVREQLMSERCFVASQR